MITPFCSEIFPQFLIFSPNVPAYIYYSHFTALITSFIVLFFIIKSGRDKFSNGLLIFTFSAFISWVVLALIFWASNRGDVIMFVWSVTLIVEPLVYIGAFYLLYYLAEKKDLSFLNKLLLFILCLPLIIFVPTKYGLTGFDVTTCLAVEGPLALYYTYALEALMTLIIIIYSVKRYRKPVAISSKELLFISMGIFLFLLAFAWGNIIGSFTENWQLGQFGLFGMPIFLGFLVYSIVKFRTFDVKIIGTQALVVGLWIALLAVLFVRTIENVRVIVSLTLILFLIVGVLLIRSVLREVRQREEIAKMAEDVRRAYVIEKRAKEKEEKSNEDLKKLDEVKNQFLQQVQHDLRSPLGVIRNYCDLLIGGGFGKLSKKSQEIIKRIEVVAENKIKDVNNFLDTTQFQLGKRVVTLKPGIEMGPILEEIVADEEQKAKAKGIYLKFENFPKKLFIEADREKLKGALFNIIDNAINYTEKGGVTVKVSNHDTVKITVTDTGIGISKEKVATLFNTVFERGEEAKKASPNGRGMGGYLSKKIIEAHNGKIWVESEGEGKGSTFHVELPAK